MTDASRRTLRGFTIVEIAIVIIIIGILSGITAVSYRSIQRDADTKEVEADLRQAANKLQLHKANNGAYPVTQAEVDGGKGLPKSQSTRAFNYSRINSQNFCLSMASARFDTVFRISTNAANNQLELNQGGC